MTDEQTPQVDVTTAPGGAWQDMLDRLKRGEREMLLELGACALAVLQFLIGATGGAVVTTAMLMNLALIGWLGNTAWSRRRAGQGSGLLALVAVAFTLAALSTLCLAQGISELLTGIEALDYVGY